MSETSVAQKLEELKVAIPGIDTEKGITYCGMDPEFYLEMLLDYSTNNKLKELTETFQNEDWTNYQIYAHALKSTSLTVGIQDLSEQAKKLEAAVKQADYDYVRANHETVMEAYRKAVDAISTL